MPKRDWSPISGSAPQSKKKHGSDPACPFLSLPGEIRNMIFGYCGPSNGHVQQFKGLILSCKQVKTEYETETLRWLVRFSIVKAWPHKAKLVLFRPKTLRDVSRIRIHLPMSLYYILVNATDDLRARSHQVQNAKLEMCLAPIFRLYLTRLTVKLYEDTRKVNYDLEHIPRGLMWDIASMLIEQPAPIWDSAFEIETREFQLGQPLHVQEYVFYWISETNNPGERRWVDKCHTNFFRHLEMRWGWKEIKVRAHHPCWRNDYKLWRFPSERRIQ